MSSALSMGGYGVYVWTSFAVFALFLAWDALVPPLRRRRLLRQVALRMRRDAARTSQPIKDCSR